MNSSLSESCASLTFLFPFRTGSRDRENCKKRLIFHVKSAVSITVRQEPITRNIQLPDSAVYETFPQVELFSDIKAFEQISSQ